MRCNHHEEEGGIIRLYMSAGDGRYIDLRREEVARIEEILGQTGQPTPSAGTKLGSEGLRELLADLGQAHNLDADLLASVMIADGREYPDSVRRAVEYLDSLLTRYHDNVALALAAYHSGPEAVDKYHGIPPYRETRRYVNSVIHEFNRRVLAREGESQTAQ